MPCHARRTRPDACGAQRGLGLHRMTQTAKAGAGKKIEIFYSRLAVWAATLLLAYAGWTIGYWVVLGLFSGHVLAAIVGAGAAIVGLPLLLSFVPAMVHAWRHRGPVLTLDDHGVTDVRKKASFVAWAEIGAIRRGSGETASFLCFELRRAGSTKQDLAHLGSVGLLLLRLRSLSDWNITLRLLACNNRQLLDSARRMHQQSIRHQIVALQQQVPRPLDPS